MILRPRLEKFPDTLQKEDIPSRSSLFDALVELGAVSAPVSHFFNRDFPKMRLRRTPLGTYTREGSWFSVR